MSTDDSSSPPGGLGPPRFGTRALFVLTTGIGIAMVVWQWVGPALGLTLFMTVLVIFAHVAGNAIGNRLRDTAPMNRGLMSGGNAAPAHPVRGDRLADEHYAPVTRLSHRVPLGRLLLIASICGGVVSGGAGAWFLHWLYPRTANWTTLLVGGVATAAIGAVFAFWLLSLAHVFLGAWWQAHRHSERHR